MRNFNDYLRQKQTEQTADHPFDRSSLADKFIPYFESQQRIEVEFIGSDGNAYETKRGTVGVTTGWRPAFILKLTSRSIGSCYTLSSKDRILRVIK